MRIHLGGISLLAALCASIRPTPALAGGGGGGGGGRDGAAPLSATLSLSDGTIAPGEELEVTVALLNRGAAAVAILEDTAFVGSQLVVLAPDGARISLEGGLATYSPKAGLFVGRAVRLLPGSTHLLRFRAYLDERRRLLCSASEASGNVAPDVARALGLPASFPARYVAPGRVFTLRERGTYRIAYRLEQTAADRAWQLGEGGFAGWQAALWLGTLESPAVELTVR